MGRTPSRRGGNDSTISAARLGAISAIGAALITATGGIIIAVSNNDQAPAAATTSSPATSTLPPAGAATGAAATTAVVVSSDAKSIDPTATEPTFTVPQIDPTTLSLLKVNITGVRIDHVSNKVEVSGTAGVMVGTVFVIIDPDPKSADHWVADAAPANDGTWTMTVPTTPAAPDGVVVSGYSAPRVTPLPGQPELDYGRRPTVSAVTSKLQCAARLGTICFSLLYGQPDDIFRLPPP